MTEATVIKAEPGFVLVLAKEDKDGAYREYDREPIIAWGIDPDGRPNPITVGGLERWAIGKPGILYPDGRVHWGGDIGGLYSENVDQWFIDVTVEVKANKGSATDPS
jgi:hypothetical protein